MKVLIAEKNNKFRELLVQRLNESGLEVYGSGDLIESEEIITQLGLKYVVLDISGFGRQSLEFMQNVLRRDSGIKFILITRKDNVPLSIEAMKLGAYDEIAVPVDIAILNKKLLAAAAKPGRSREVS
ncbi:response regulator [Maridesulfovibrio bastinii]|uniref:response regulator n=1 Tax=Maridesulfovibrio bastinii TaxID=47157 RepID=UPI00040F386F|nr:response regulator [Maridesulfovibrio bastinii]